MPPSRADGLNDALNHLRAAAADPGDQWFDRLNDELASGSRPPQRAVELTAPRGLLRELLLVAIDEVGEALSANCTALLRGESPAEAVRTGVVELGELLELLETVDR